MKKERSKVVKYKDLISIKVNDCGEEMVFLKSVPGGYVKGTTGMRRYLGQKILVRKSVAERLEKAQQILQKRNPEMSLYVTYGYRSYQVQTKRFLKYLKKQAALFYPDPAELYEQIHRFIAVPTVAGHPTGGAVDIIITKDGESLDFGSAQYDYTNNMCEYLNAPTPESFQNRKILREVMTKVGFAPFSGEWWHFSYGDREWACYYDKKEALYGQIHLEDVKKQLICQRRRKKV